MIATGIAMVFSVPSVVQYERREKSTGAAVEALRGS